MSERTFFSIGAVIILLFTGLKRIYGEKGISKKHPLVIDGVIYGFCILLLGYYFYYAGLKIGVVMAGLCGIALGKFLLDKSKSEKE